MTAFNDRGALRLIFFFFSMICSRGQTRMYWTETRPEGAFVMTANADGSNPHAIVSGDANIKGPNGLEYGNGLLYWPDQQLSVISKVKPDGSELGVFTSVTNAYDVFITSERVYWTSRGSAGNSRIIDSAKLDGSDIARAPATVTVRPFAIEVTTSYLLWSQINSTGSAILSYDLNKKSSGAFGVFSVMVYDMQAVGDFLYFGDNNTPAKIKKVDMREPADVNGANVQTVLTVDFLHGLFVTKDAIYWADLNSIRRAGLNGENPVPLYLPPANTQVRGIVVLDDNSTSAQPSLGNPRRVGNDFVFTVQATAGKTIHVEKSGVSTTSWNPFTTFIAGTGPTTITNQIGPSTKAEFFRATSE